MHKHTAIVYEICFTFITWGLFTWEIWNLSPTAETSELIQLRQHLSCSVVPEILLILLFAVDSLFLQCQTLQPGNHLNSLICFVSVNMFGMSKLDNFFCWLTIWCGDQSEQKIFWENIFSLWFMANIREQDLGKFIPVSYTHLTLPTTPYV